MDPIAQTFTPVATTARPSGNAAPAGAMQRPAVPRMSGEAPLAPPEPPRPILHLQDAKMALKDAERAYFLARVAAGPALLADDQT